MELSTSYQYLATPARFYAGVGVLAQIDREVERAGAKRAFIVCSETVARTSNLLDRTREALGDRYGGAWDGCKKESPVPIVLAGLEAVREAKPDLIVAVGGGSAVITARAITILLGEGKTIEELYTKHVPGEAPVVSRNLAPKLPNILVLTTPTTGADRGGAAVLDDKHPRRKELYDPKTRPLSIFLDGEALLTAPLPLYLETSLSVFLGSVGSLQTPTLTPFAYADIRQALELTMTYLPQLVARPDDPEPRIHLGAAALLANRASQSTYTFGGRGRSTGLGTQIRYLYPDISQGAIGALMAMMEMRANREANLEGQARVAELMGVRRQGMSDADAADAATEAVGGILQSVGMSTRLRDLGVQKSDFPALANYAATEPGFSQGRSRQITDENELVRILEDAW